MSKTVEIALLIFAVAVLVLAAETVRHHMATERLGRLQFYSSR